MRILKKIVHFYYEGFRQMTWGKSLWVIILVKLFVMFFVLSIALILKYVEKERSRDLVGWQSRLAILVDIQRSKIENQLVERKDLLEELASNPSLQLYLSQYKLQEGSNDEVMHAQFAHVRNLLSATSKRFGFAESGSRDSTNTEYFDEKHYGLAVLGAEGGLLLATRGFPRETSRGQ